MSKFNGVIYNDLRKKTIKYQSIEIFEKYYDCANKTFAMYVSVQESKRRLYWKVVQI